MGKKQEEQIYQERRQQETPKRSTTENQGNNLQISIKQKKELNLSTVHTHTKEKVRSWNSILISFLLADITNLIKAAKIDRRSGHQLLESSESY